MQGSHRFGVIQWFLAITATAVTAQDPFPLQRLLQFLAREIHASDAPVLYIGCTRSC